MKDNSSGRNPLTNGIRKRFEKSSLFIDLYKLANCTGISKFLAVRKLFQISKPLDTDRVLVGDKVIPSGSMVAASTEKISNVRRDRTIERSNDRTIDGEIE